MHEKVSVVIVGAGPAGIAAGMFLKRAGVEPLLLEEREPGGLLREANLVENYPGFPGGISGKELASLMVHQMEKLGVRLEIRSVTKISPKGRSFVTETETGTYESDTVIIATGTAPKKLEIEGAGELEGRRLFYGLASIGTDAIRGKRVLVLGGGDAAFDYAINMSTRGNPVAIVSRSTASCLPLLLERAEARGIEVSEGCTPERMTESMDEVVVECACGDEKKIFKADIVTAAYGREPRVDMLPSELRERVDDSGEGPPMTGIEGLFVAGDVVRGIHRQAAIAAGDGILAAMHVEQLLRKRGGVES
ncbi:MAG: NAD(P)/FAD-dependent oxidoreductase [Candidatus Thermoplasmatota archaeon]|nr:NAD(P)/FAD-dependent oxidoreductase [Candidatus Thermoplasmatota archaeon]